MIFIVVTRIETLKVNKSPKGYKSGSLYAPSDGIGISNQSETNVTTCSNKIQEHQNGTTNVNQSNRIVNNSNDELSNYYSGSSQQQFMVSVLSTQVHPAPPPTHGLDRLFRGLNFDLICSWHESSRTLASRLGLKCPSLSLQRSDCVTESACLSGVEGENDLLAALVCINDERQCLRARPHCHQLLAPLAPSNTNNN